MGTSREIEAIYQATYGERLRAAWNMTLRAPIALLILSAFPIAGLFLLWAMSLPTSKNNFIDYILVFVCITYIPAIFLWGTYRSHVAAMKKGPHHYRFDSEGIHTSTATSELTHRWPAILRVRESQGILFLYYTKRCAHIVPLRALASPEESAAIQQLATEGGVSRVGT